jgi:hypothetical protein
MEQISLAYLLLGHYSLRDDSNKIAKIAVGREEHNGHTSGKNAIDLGVQIALRK